LHERILATTLQASHKPRLTGQNAIPRFVRRGRKLRSARRAKATRSHDRRLSA
jgi:hypothetical protein